MNTLQKNIAEQISSGFVTIDSFEGFNKLLKRFPHEPLLQKAAADFMMRKNMAGKAALSYRRAAALFLKSGNLLPAIASIVSSWRITPPTDQEAKLFLSAVRDDSFPKTPLKIFLEALSNPEVMAIVKILQNIQLPQQRLLQKINDIQQNLYFIVTGDLKEICFQPVKSGTDTVYRQYINNLSANDSIGELYPISENKSCRSNIETISAVDLVKLSKPSLAKVCKQFPNVESGLKTIDVFRKDFQKENRLKKKRQAIRLELKRKISIEIHPQASDNFPILLEGYSTDISIGGTCIVLNAKDLGVAQSVASFARTIKNSKVRISFPTEGLELKVSGKIAWTQKVVFQREPTLTLGIEFQDLSPKFRTPYLWEEKLTPSA